MSHIDESSQKQISLGIILQYVQMSLSIIIQLIYTPVMLRILGSTEYGIYNLTASIISYLNLLSLGFGASYIRYYSKYKKNGDVEGIKSLNGLYLIVFSVIGLIALICGIFLVFNVEIFYNNTYTELEIEVARKLMLFLTINLTISFPASLFVSYVTSQEKFIFQKLLNIGKTVLSPALSIVFLYNGYGSVGMVVITTIVSFTVDFINIFYCFFFLKMKIKIEKPKMFLLKDIFIFSSFIAINQIIDQINWQTDKIILGKMINGTAVAIYVVGANINTMFTSFSTAISNVFIPKIHRIVSKAEFDMDSRLTEIFIKVGRLQWFVLMLILTGFIFYGKYFIFRWAGEDYQTAYYVALLLMCPVVIPSIQNIGIEIQRAKNKHQFRSIIYLFMAIINVGISILFCYLWGEIGAALGTTISLIVANGIIMNIYYHKKIGINIIDFWKSIFSTLPAFVFPTIFGVLCMHFLTINSILVFCLLICSYSLLYFVSILNFGLNMYEKQQVKNIFGKIFRRKNNV